MSTYEDLVAAVETPPRVRETLLALEKRLADHRVVGSSPDGAVSVTVSGAGELLAVVVLDRALRGAHPHQVGPAIVATVHAARLEAARYARDQQRLVFDPGAQPTPSVQTSVVLPPVAPEAPPPRRAGARVATDDGDDLFQGFGSHR